MSDEVITQETAQETQEETQENVLTIDEISAKIDGLIPSEDNKEVLEGAADIAEEALITKLEARIAELEANYEKAVSAIDKMVLLYGARVSGENTSEGIEAFKTATVEQTFPDSLHIDGVVPLDQIKLGS